MPYIKTETLPKTSIVSKLSEFQLNHNFIVSKNLTTLKYAQIQFILTFNCTKILTSISALKLTELRCHRHYSKSLEH